MTTTAHDPAPLAWPHWAGPAERLAPPPGPGATAAALAWLEGLGERQAWPPRALMALTLCADEALANIASHARAPDGGPARLQLECGPTPGGLALRIEDDGAPFDPTAQASPALAASLDEARAGGHGLRLMRHYLHQLLYRREGSCNVLLLEVAL